MGADVASVNSAIISTVSLRERINSIFVLSLQQMTSVHFWCLYRHDNLLTHLTAGKHVAREGL